MNYKRIYDEIINNRKNNPINEGYTERHHIVPSSLGGSDNPDNLIRLSAREHFICHYLLAKMYEYNSFEWHKTNHAFMQMKASSETHNRYFNSYLYESLRINFSKVMSLSQSGKCNSQYGSMWIYNLELKESKRIPKGDIPDGWLKGRKMKFDDKFCPKCNKVFHTTLKYCSTECKAMAKKEFIVSDNFVSTLGRKHTKEDRMKMSIKMKEVRKHNKWISNKGKLPYC